MNWKHRQARENKFLVRDFTYNEEALKSGLDEWQDHILAADKMFQQERASSPSCTQTRRSSLDLLCAGLRWWLQLFPFLNNQLHFPTFRSTLVKVSQHGFTWRPWESLLSLSWGDLLNSLLIFPFGLFNNLRRPSFPMDKIVFSRFGLPVNFQGMVVLPQKKQATYPFNSVWKCTSFLQVKKLRECLNDIYFHLDSAGG